MLETPSLEYLMVVGYLYEINVQKRLSSLVEAEFRSDLHDADIYEPSICDSVVELVRAFDCAKTLLLSGDAMWALSLARISLSTEFKRLVKLETALNNAKISLSTEFKRLVKFVTRCFCCHCCLPQDFIQSSDNLEDVIIFQNSNWVNESNGHDHLMWT